MDRSRGNRESPIRPGRELFAVGAILAVYVIANIVLFAARTTMVRSARASVDSLLTRDRGALDGDLLQWRGRMLNDGRWVAAMLTALQEARPEARHSAGRVDEATMSRLSALARDQIPGARIWVFDAGGYVIGSMPGDTATDRHRWVAMQSVRRDTAVVAAAEARGRDLRIAVATPVRLHGIGPAAVVVDVAGIEQLDRTVVHLVRQARGGRAAIGFPYGDGFVGVTWAAGSSGKIGWPKTGWSLSDSALIVVGGTLPDTTHVELAVPTAAAESLVGTRLAWMHAGMTAVTLALCLTVLLVGRARRNAELVAADRSLAASRLRAAQAEAAATRAGLAQLSARLNPHFLSNAMHSVSVLVGADPDAAEEALDRLGDLFRYSVEHSERQSVALEDEWRFVKDYIAIEQMRLGARLRVTMDLDPDAAEHTVPTFVLQPFVENAIRHGIGPRASGGVVQISARLRGGCVELTVQDDGVGVEPGRIATASGTGIRTLRQRLSLDPDLGGSMDITTSPGAGFRVRLLLAARTPEGAGGSPREWMTPPSPSALRRPIAARRDGPG